MHDAIDGRSLASSLIERWSAGDQEALAELVPLVYAELRRLARHYIRNEQGAVTLQGTALLHEVYLRLSQGAAVGVRTREHFFAIAGRVMRQVLCDYGRARNRVKRGSGVSHTELDDEHLILSQADADQILALDQALSKLAEFDARKAQVVELRYFAGLEVSEAAQVLGVSENTVIRDWSIARAWLRRALGEEHSQ